MEEYVYEPDHLNCLPEGLRRILGNHSAVSCDLEKFFLSLLISAFSCLTFCLVCHPVCICDKSSALDYACLPVVDLSLVLHGLRYHIVDVSLTFIHVSLDTDGEDLLMVAGGLTGNAVGKAYSDDIVLHAFSDMRRESSRSDIFHSLAVPVFKSLKDFLPVFRCNVIRVLGSCGELIYIRDIPGA